MRTARSIRAAGFAVLLACSVATVAGTAQIPATEAIAPASEMAVPAPSGEPSPFHPPSFPKMVLLDTGHVLTSPFRWRGRDWALLSASTAAIAALSLADEPVSDAARERGTTLGLVGDTLEGLGDGRSVLLLGGFFLAGAIGRDAKAKSVFLDGLSASLIANGMITPALSTLVGRERPTAERGAYGFRSFHGRSLPSGHSTQAFAVASVIATSYDQLWVKVVAYGAATAASYARVRRGKHFPSDVVVGAVIGTAVGRSVVRFNRRLRSGERETESPPALLTIVPMVGRGTLGVSASLDF